MTSRSSRYLKCASLILGVVVLTDHADADSQGQPIVTDDGVVITMKNPYLGQMGPAAGPGYLTTQQMQSSVPAALLTTMPTGFSSGHPAASLEQPASEQPEVVAPTLPDPNADSAAQLLYPDRWTSIAQPTSSQRSFAVSPCAQPNGWGSLLDCYYHPWTETPGNVLLQYRRSYPWKAVGQLFFHEANEPINNFYHHCTAQVISGPPRNLIVTAAHCVVDQKGRPSKDLFFVPASFNGEQPYGQFKYQLALALPEFVKTYSSRYDVALVSLQNDPTGKPVSYYTGTLGLLLNASYFQNLTVMGYSIKLVPEGAWTTVVNGQSYQIAADKSCPELNGDDILFMGSPLVQGSSGGGWINSFYPFDSSALNSNYVASVVSGDIICHHGSTSPPDIFDGPRFSDANIGILCKYISGGCGNPVGLLPLTAAVTGPGNIASTPPGLVCGSETGKTETCKANFAGNSSVTLSAIADRGGHVLIGWGGACSGTNTTCVVKMSVKQTLTARFQ